MKLSPHQVKQLARSAIDDALGQIRRTVANTKHSLGHVALALEGQADKLEFAYSQLDEYIPDNPPPAEPPRHWKTPMRSSLEYAVRAINRRISDIEQHIDEAPDPDQNRAYVDKLLIARQDLNEYLAEVYDARELLASDDPPDPRIRPPAVAPVPFNTMARVLRLLEERVRDLEQALTEGTSSYKHDKAKIEIMRRDRDRVMRHLKFRGTPHASSSGIAWTEDE